MNDPNLLREISDNAIAFDRTHFADGIEPISETMVEHHLQLKTDRKLITRLQPRFAVALGFFEGYAQATFKWGTIDGKPLLDWILERLDAKPGEGLVAAIERNRRENAEFRRAIRTALGQSSDVVGSLVDDVAQVVKERDELRSARTLSRDTVLMELSRTRESISRLAAFAAFANATEIRDTAEKFVQDAIDRLSKSDEPKNIGIVIKPPPPPPPPAAPSEIISREHGNDIRNMRIVFLDGVQIEWDSESGAGVTLCELPEFLRRHRRNAIGQIETDVMLNKPPSAAAPKPNELRTEIDDELARAAADYASDVEAMMKLPSDAALVREIVIDEKESGSGVWDGLVKGFVEGARWQLSKVENAHVGDKPTMHFPSAFDGHANACTDAERMQYEKTIELQRARIAELESLIASSSEPSPIVFRDNNERDFWDEQVHALNRRGDRSSRDVALAADEMVEERRKRMSIRIVSEMPIRPVIVGIPQETQMNEITDELLLEAAKFANDECSYSYSVEDVGAAREAVAMDAADPKGEWSSVIRGYVNGALRKVRKT